ncbi:MAG: hypothetical protein WDN03_15570 [Rhizomicrobium sp.]
MSLLLALTLVPALAVAIAFGTTYVLDPHRPFMLPLPTYILSVFVVGVGPLTTAAGALWYLTILRRNAALAQARWPALSLSLLLSRYGALRAEVIWVVLAGIVRQVVWTILFGIAFMLIAFAGVASGEMIAPHPDTIIDSDFFITTELLAGSLFFATISLIGSVIALVRRRGAPSANVAVLMLSASSAAAAAFYVVIMLHSYMVGGPLTVMLDGRDASVLFAFWSIFALRNLLARPIFLTSERLQAAVARTARDLTARRPEKPVLFLRSFLDDEQSVPADESSFGAAMGFGRRTMRIEEIVADVMFSKAPLIALQNPAIRARPIGAARDLAPMEGWHDVVRRYISAAQIVICFFGTTPSFIWEMEHIMSGDKARAMILVFPPNYQLRQLLHEAAPELARHLGISDAAQERVVLAGARALAYDPSAATYRLFTSKRSSALAYREALVRCALLTTPAA